MKSLQTMAVLSVLLAMPGIAMAERVFVKSYGEVDLAPFQCETIAHSPNVRRLCYDGKRQYALVSISGVWYHYCGVPATTMGEWKRSLSKGRYYNDRIRGNFDCTTSVVDQPLREVDGKASAQPPR